MMSNVIAGAAMSLDGFIADTKGNLGRLYEWFFDDPSRSTLEILEELDSLERVGAVVMGKRAYELGEPGGFEGYEYQVPLFILTHHIPDTIPSGANENMTFTYVTNGIESAIAQAKAAAADKDVMIVGGANTFQQAFNAGLINELNIGLVPVLLGNGIRLFENITVDNVQLEKTTVMDASGVTHLKYHFIK